MLRGQRREVSGSLSAHGTKTISYHPERRSVRLDAAGAPVRAADDGDGIRCERLDENGTNRCVSGAYERNVGDAQDTSALVTTYDAASRTGATR